MTGISIHLDDSEVHELADDINRHAEEFTSSAGRVIEKGGFEMQREAQILAPVDTGFLKGSITIDHSPLGFDLGPTAEYGDYVERGVPHPWVITAHDGGMLHFVIDGHDVFAKSVVHPPMAPQPYLGPAFDSQLPNIEQALGELGAQAISRA